MQDYKFIFYIKLARKRELRRTQTHGKYYIILII